MHTPKVSGKFEERISKYSFKIGMKYNNSYCGLRLFPTIAVETSHYDKYRINSTYLLQMLHLIKF